MSFIITSRDYVKYIKIVSKRIYEKKDYITSLDAATGDGDHWVNINAGFQSLVENADNLKNIPIYKTFNKIGMLMMSKIGGSSGILYGGAYMAASKAVSGKENIDSRDLCVALEAMVIDMMERGEAKPGFKTMIDSLYPAVQVYKESLASGVGNLEIIKLVKEAALNGAYATRDMEAVKGRASYQINKGVGHLDPGAITMSYQIECLCNYIINHLINNNFNREVKVLIKNKPTKKSDRIVLLRNAIEHRATWGALLIDEAKKRGIDTSFAHEAIKRCGIFHGNNKYPRTDDLQEFASAFANKDVIDAFEMEIRESDDKRLYIDFHYCPLVNAWLRLGLTKEDISELCDIAMDGDRGIISTYPKFTFELGKTIADGDDFCEIRINKLEK